MYIYCHNNPVTNVDPSGESMASLSHTNIVLFLGQGQVVTANANVGGITWENQCSDIISLTGSGNTRTIRGLTTGKALVRVKFVDGGGRTWRTMDILVEVKASTFTNYGFAFQVQTKSANTKVFRNHLLVGTQENIANANTTLNVFGGNGSSFVVARNGAVWFVAKSAVRPIVPAGLNVGTVYFLRNVRSNRYLDVRGANTASGAEVQQFPFNGTRAQQWALRFNTSDGFAKFEPQHSTSRRLAAGTDDAHANQVNTPMRIANQASNERQKFIIARVGVNTFRLVMMYSVFGTRNTAVGLGTVNDNNSTIVTTRANGGDTWEFRGVNYRNIVQNDFATSTYRNMFRDMPIPAMYNNIVRERDRTPAQALQRLRESNVFVFSGHGSSEVLQLTGGNLERTTIRDLPDNSLAGVRMVLLIACNTGEGGRNATNLMTTLRGRGAHVVVGWDGEPGSPPCHVWANQFMTLLSQGLNIRDARDQTEAWYRRLTAAQWGGNTYIDIIDNLLIIGDMGLRITA